MVFRKWKLCDNKELYIFFRFSFSIFPFSHFLWYKTQDHQIIANLNCVFASKTIILVPYNTLFFGNANAVCFPMKMFQITAFPQFSFYIIFIGVCLCVSVFFLHFPSQFVCWQISCQIQHFMPKKKKNWNLGKKIYGFLLHTLFHSIDIIATRIIWV